MATTNKLEMIIDRSTGTLIQGMNTTATKTLPTLVRGDKYKVHVRVVDPTGDVDNPWREITIGTSLVSVAVGVPNPTLSGSVTVTYGTATSAAIDVAATAATFGTALNDMATVTAAGGVTVSGDAGGPYHIVWDSTGARTAWTINDNYVFPKTDFFIDNVVEGDGSNRAYDLGFYVAKPFSKANLSVSDPSAAAVTITTITAGTTGVNEVQQVDISDPLPYGGTFSLTFNTLQTAPIAWNAAAADIEAALEAVIGTDAVSVTGEFPVWKVEFKGPYGNQNVAAMTGDGTGLKIPGGKIGTLDLNSDTVYQYLTNSTTSLTGYIEVELADSGDYLTANFQTVYRAQVTVVSDINTLYGNSVGTQITLAGFN